MVGDYGALVQVVGVVDARVVVVVRFGVRFVVLDVVVRVLKSQPDTTEQQQQHQTGQKWTEVNLKLSGQNIYRTVLSVNMSQVAAMMPLSPYLKLMRLLLAPPGNGCLS